MKIIFRCLMFIIRDESVKFLDFPFLINIKLFFSSLFLFFIFFFFIFTHIFTIIYIQQISISCWRFVCSVYIHANTDTFFFHSFLPSLLVLFLWKYIHVQSRIYHIYIYMRACSISFFLSFLYICPSYINI